MDNVQLSLFGRTCPELSAATGEKIFEPYLTSLLESSSRTPLCLRFRKQAGPTPTATPETDGVLRTEFLTLNTGESPSVAVVSTLSSILEANAPEKYYLSARACEGILRRAERRGKELPKMLREALLQMIERETAQAKRAIWEAEDQLRDEGLLEEPKDEVRDLSDKAGTEGVMPTLCSDSHGTPHAVAYSFDSLASNSMKSKNPHSGCRAVEVAKTLDTTDPNPGKNQGGIAVVEAVPYTLKIRYGCAVDSAGKAAGKGALVQVNKAATLTARCGTGGNNVPAVVAGEPVYCLQGNGIDRADTAGCNGKGWKEDSSYTLNTIDRPAVAYCMGNGQLNQINMSEVCNTLDCMHDQQAVLYQDTVGALCARDYKGVGSQYVGEDKLVIAPSVQFIVRRLTPTECARLQGFPDAWGHPDKLDSFTPEEYRFWLEVRNTHTAINCKQAKDYTEDQMLKWYNGLNTDSAEYKMWGNGIALPPALYCMQGIAEALEKEAEVIGQ